MAVPLHRPLLPTHPALRPTAHCLRPSVPVPAQVLTHVGFLRRAWLCLSGVLLPWCPHVAGYRAGLPGIMVSVKKSLV